MGAMPAPPPIVSGKPKRARALTVLRLVAVVAAVAGVLVSTLAIRARIAIEPFIGLYKPPPIVVIAAFPQWLEWVVFALPAIALVAACALVLRKPGVVAVSAAACLVSVALTTSALVVVAAAQWAFCSFSCYTDGPQLFLQAPLAVGQLLGLAMLPSLVAIVLGFTMVIWAVVVAARKSPRLAGAAAAVSLIIPIGTCGAWTVSDRFVSPTPNYRAALAPPPSDCAAPGVSQLRSGQWAGAYGKSPVWISGLSTAATPLPTAAAPAPYLRATSLDSRGWSAYHVWLLEPQLTQPVEIRGNDDSTGAPLWFRHPSYTRQYLPTLALDPAAPDFPAGTGDGTAGPFNMFQVGLVVDHAACYTIVASWPGGTMKLDVAIGGN